MNFKSDFYSMKIELNQQLRASVPSDAIALKIMIMAEFGVDDLE